MKRTVVHNQARKSKAPFSFREKGQFFPIRYRVVDKRVAPGVASTDAQIQSRFNSNEDRHPFITGSVRQTIVPTHSMGLRPTHFISLRVPRDSQFIGDMHAFHAQTKDFNEEAMSLLIPLSKLHVTLGVAAIGHGVASDRGAEGSKTVTETQNPDNNNSNNNISNINSNNTIGNDDVVGSAVNEFCQRIENIVTSSKLGNITLYIRGCGQFNNGRVVFAKVNAERQFVLLDDLVMRIRRDIGGTGGMDRGIINLKGNPYDSYVPHITIAKIRANNNQHSIFNKCIPVDVWSTIQYHDFGEITFDALDICEMKTDPDTGYYRVVKSIPL
eukprot:Tbor_TRINITY_DN5334_c1_g4::TRINITY_DN5334_c1_g4_i1::g.4592::m.4592